MTTVHIVQSARKARPEYGINIGDTYYWWEFRYGGKHFSKTPPTRSQTTNSPFLSELYALEDNLIFDREDLESSRDNLVSDIQNLIEQCQDSLNNMPDHLQESSPAGQTLQERIDALESWVNDLESADLDIDDELSAEEREERIDAIIEELGSYSSGL